MHNCIPLVSTHVPVWSALTTLKRSYRPNPSKSTTIRVTFELNVTAELVHSTLNGPLDLSYKLAHFTLDYNTSSNQSGTLILKITGVLMSHQICRLCMDTQAQAIGSTLLPGCRVSSAKTKYPANVLESNEHQARFSWRN